MVTNMTAISGRRPAKRYFARAKPPRLLRVTTSAVWSEERNRELIIQRANGSRVKRGRKLSSVRSPSRPQGRKATAKTSCWRLNAAHASHRNGTTTASASSASIMCRSRVRTPHTSGAPRPQREAHLRERHEQDHHHQHPPDRGGETEVAGHEAV